MSYADEFQENFARDLARLDRQIKKADESFDRALAAPKDTSQPKPVKLSDAEKARRLAEIDADIADQGFRYRENAIEAARQVKREEIRKGVEELGRPQRDKEASDLEKEQARQAYALSHPQQYKDMIACYLDINTFNELSRTDPTTYNDWCHKLVKFGIVKEYSAIFKRVQRENLPKLSAEELARRDSPEKFLNQFQIETFRKMDQSTVYSQQIFETAPDLYALETLSKTSLTIRAGSWVL